MPAKKKILNILSKRILILDGATGTELQKRGMPPGYNPEAWALKNPELLKEVHSEYKFAGADIVYTSTFGANPFKLAKYKLQDKVFKINKELAHIARRAVGKDILVAGDLGPSGIFVEPWGVLGFEELVYSYKQQVKGLLAAGVDLFVIETMMDIQEARAALLAVKELTDKFVMVTLTYDKYGRTLNGTDSLSALVTLQSLGADAVGCNCSTGPQEMAKLIKLMKPYATVPLIAKPNAGIPRLVNGKTFFSQKSPEFVRHCRELISAGANIIGGCCGTSPEYIRQLSRVLKNKKPQVSRRKSLSALASARKSVFINEEKKVVIVGERINPTGKKVLQKELLKSNLSLVLQMAKEQEKAGAMILDVNLSVAGADEQKLIRKAIGLLARSTSLPLVIDSPDPATVECAARIYPDRKSVV